MRFWFDEHVGNGPLNGAMEHNENTPWQRHDKLQVRDINGIAQQPAPYTNLKKADIRQREAENYWQHS